jgi:hypothetical protein
MTALVWTELESASGQLADAQKRLEAAKSVGSFDVAAVLEREIAEMEERRGNLLARIANGVFGKEIDAAHAMEGPEVTGAPEKDGTIEVAAPGTGQVEGNEVESSLTVLPSTTAPELNRPTGTGISAQRDPEEKDKAMWQQLTPDDVNRARQELGQQRSEMLARHAEELKSLDAERAEVDTLEQGIASFVRKFSGSVAGGAVVLFDRSAEAHKSAS